jgi:glycosyltransferase involved in cell wall biosynthesis
MSVRSAFAINARAQAGGQGQFLSLMVRALAGTPATIFSRGAAGAGLNSVNLPFLGPRRGLFDILLGAPYLRGRQDWLTLLSDTQFDRSVAAHLSREESAPDIFDGVMAQCAESSRAAAKAGARVVLTSLNTHISYLRRSLDEEYARAGDKGRHFVHPRMEQRALAEIAAADHIRVNSHFAKTTFVDAGHDPSRISVIHPAIDLAHFRERPREDDTFRVMAVASIDPRKGIHDLIAGFVDAALPDAELDIIGGTSDRWSRRLIDEATRRHANIRVRSLDVSHAPVEESYARASVLVHPAIEDGFGLVVAQALAAGRPVIATSTSGASELIRHGENGFVVPPRSSREIAEHLRALASDRGLRERLSSAARPSVTHLTYDAFGRAVREMYARL